MFVNVAQIKKRAKEKGLSISYLCRMAEKNTSYIENVSRYNISVADETVGIWAGLLDTTVEYLCGETEDPSVPQEQIKDEEIQIALFGGEKATAEEWEEVKKFVDYLKSKRNR